MQEIFGIQYILQNISNKNKILQIVDNYKHFAISNNYIKDFCYISQYNSNAEPAQILTNNNASANRYFLAHRGDIYNIKELKNILTNKNIAFLSDNTEDILLQIFINFNTNSFKLIKGSFAIIFYDSLTNTYLIGKDFIGACNIYYYFDNETIIISSKLDNILKCNISTQLSAESLLTYFQLNYIPAYTCIYDNINKLAAGSYLEIKNNIISTHSYYTFPRYANNYTKDDYNSAKHKTRQLLDNSILECIDTNKSYACLLSGGIDSSIVTALTSKYNSKLCTFSLGYKDDKFFDETQHAELFASRYKTNHTSFKITNADMLSSVHTCLNSFEEPYADSSALALNILCFFLDNKFDFVLSGDGADEIFGGYNKHAAHLRATNLSFKHKLIVSLSDLWRILPKSRNSKYANLFRQLDKFSSGCKLSPFERYWQWASIGNYQYASSLLNIDIDNNKYETIKNHYSNIDFTDINNILYADMHLVLQGDMLPKVKYTSENHNLLIRSPFLNPELIDYAFQLPVSYKIVSNNRKRILKDSFADILDMETLSRPKHGFEFPLLKLMQKDLWTTIDNDLLSESFIKDQNIFNYHIIKDLKNRLYSSNSGDTTNKIWALLVFQQWWLRNSTYINNSFTKHK